MAKTDTRANLQMFRELPDPGNVANGKRIYQAWRGSNKFFCGGRLVFGPDVRSLLLTLILILAPIAIFCVFVGRHLMKDFPHHSGIAIMVVAVTATCGVLVLLLLTSGRDPGIIPRNNHPPEPEEEGTSSSDWNGRQTPKLRLPRTKDVIVNGVAVKIKYCDTCMLYRPPRCSHCSICNNCVERFDHHCPWVGQCIGRRNYRYFFMFVLSTTLLCFFVFAMCALQIKKVMYHDSPHTIWRALQRSPASAFLMAYAFLATWFVGGLTTFHLYLMATNQTTYENFRYRYDNKVNPYDQGPARNVKEILCSGIPQSKVNFRAKVEAKATVFGNLNAKPKEIIDAFSPNNMKPYSNVEMGAKSSWVPTALDDFVHDRNVPHNNYGGFNKQIRHTYEDDFMEGLDDSLSHERGDVRNSVAYPRHSSLGRQSGIWEVSPGMLLPTPVSRGQGNHKSPAAIPPHRYK